MAEAGAPAVRLDVEYPEQLSRLHLVAKVLLGWLYVGIPHGIILGILSVVALVLHVIAFVVVLVTGRYPRGIYDIMIGYHGWSVRVDAYTNLMTDKYPPFAMSADDYPATMGIDYQEEVSRGTALLRVLLGWLYVGIPHGIVLGVLGVIGFVLLIVAALAILFTGRYPEGIFNYLQGIMRWSLRVSAYLYLLNDKYPPFSLNR